MPKSTIVEVIVEISISLLWLTIFIVFILKYHNNIDSSKQTKESRYLLNDYISREKKKISINGVEYEVTLYQGDHSNEYLLCEMKEGKVEGRCQLFNRGILSLAWMMKNGKRVGGITEYENGKAISKEGWDSLLENGGGDRRMIENSKEGLIMTIRRKGKEDDENGCVIYRGGFDEEMNREGYGIEYDIENGKEKIEGYWNKDKLIRMIREFDADNNQMIEYAENDYNDENEKSNMEILNRIPIYIGGYSTENGKYVRNGVGYLIDEKSGTANRESEWANGKEKKEVGTDLYEGWYVKGMSESIRSILHNENPCEMKTKPTVNVPPKRIEIRNSVELNEMDLKVTELVICSNSCNDLNELNLNQFEWLESIEIGGDCFKSVKTFKIDGLNRLISLKIGKNSFTQAKSSFDNNKSKSFHILNCESLESIQIGRYSFSDFAGEFELKNLPQLQSIQIGIVGSGSWNFFYSSFVVRGIELILNIVMIRFSKSTIHCIG